MLEIKPFDAWAEANATTDPSEKLRQYADYVRTNAYKNGQLDDATNQEIEQGIVDRARVDGLISDEEPEEDRNKKLQGLLTPIQNKDADAKFLLDHYRNDFAENSPEFLEKAPTIQQYLSLKQVSPDKVGELQGLVDGYIESKSDVKNARLSAVDRGDYRVVAIDEEGGRQLYTGADTKPDNLNGELDTLISNGAISATDLNDVRKLTMPINGGQATVAEGTRYNVFANTISSLSKKDPTLRSSIDQEAAKIRESKRTEQLTTGETVFDYVKKAVAVPLDFVGGLVTEAFGLSHPEEPVAPPSELIGGNRAITERFSSGEVNQFLGDYMKHASGPFYRADKPETGLDTDSLGNVIVSPALIGNKAQFEQALKSAPLNDDQKERATIQRMAMLETEAPKILNLILGESNEAVSAYAVARAAGKAPSEFIEEWVGNNSQNYDGMSERLQQLGMSTFSAIATLPVGIGALMGIEPAAKALVAMNKEQSDREEYSRLFGDEFGLTFQLVNTIPQVATDIFATIGTGALYTGAKAIAKGGSKAIMREATRAAVSSVDDVAAASVRSASAVGGEALVGEALEKVGGSLATNLAKADKLVPLFATSFTRSAASTYGSIYGQLPDSMSADEKHRNAFGYAVASGISTAVITSGMSFLGQGGLEDLATGKFRPITAVDDSVTGMRKVSLNELTYKQAKFLNDNLTNAGAKLTDKAFQKTLTANIGGAYKNYIRTTLRGAIDEGFEESLDQAIQNRIEDAATDKNTPLAERVNQIWTAFTLGGILGGASPAVGQLVKPLNISDVSLALDARVSVLSKVASDLRKTGSTATAEVLQRQLNDAQAAANTQRQTEIAAQQQKEVQAKTEEVITQADKPLTFEPTGQAELALGDTRSNTLPQTTRFLTDFDGERAYLGSYAGTLETNGDSVRLILDEPRADGVSHLVVGNRFQPIDKSGIRLDRKRLMLTGEHSLNIPAGTPYVIPDPRKKFKFALPTDPANVSFVQSMADAPALRIENARVIGQENVSSPIILTDKGQIEDALRYYNLDPAVLMQPENVGQLELDLLEDTPAVEVATTPVANPAAVVETPVVKKSRKKKGAASTVVEEPPVVVDPTTIDPAEVIADAIETGDTPPPKAYSEEQEYVRDIVMDNQLTAALLSVKENGFTPEEINKVANGFAPEVFVDLKSRIDKATEYAMGLDDSLDDVRNNILSNLTSLVAIYKRVEVARFIQAKPAVVAEAAPIVEEAPAPVVIPERDVEEPAQMTPQEFEDAYRKDRPKLAKGMSSEQIRLLQANLIFGNAISYTQSGEKFPKPFNIEAAKSLRIKVPEGYEAIGELYVYKKPVVEEAPVVAPIGLDKGERTVYHLSSNIGPIVKGLEQRELGFSVAPNKGDVMSSPTLSERKGTRGLVTFVLSGRGMDYRNPEDKKFIDRLEEQQTENPRDVNLMNDLRKMGIDYVDNFNGFSDAKGETHVLNVKALRLIDSQATAKKTTTKKQSVTPLPDTTVVSDEENPSEDAIDLKEELTDLNTTVPVFDVDGQPTTLESLEVQFQQLDNRIQAAKESQTPIPSGVLDAYKSLRSTVNVARFAVEGKATEIKAKIKELTAPDPEVDIRTDAQKNADELLSIMKGEKQVSPEVAAAAAAVQPTPSKFKEAKGVGPVGFKGEAQPIVVFRDGVFRNAEEANIYANWVAGGFPISNLAEHGFDPRQVSGINFQSHSTEIKQRLWKDIQERFPFIPVPTGTLTTKSKRRVPYMTKAGDNYIDIPYEADSNGKPVRGVFTNNPLVTAQQIDLGLMIIIPKSVATSKGFSRNLSIDVKDTGKGSFVVTSVKRHPFDTGVFVAGDISLVGKSGTVPKKAMTNLGGILRPPAPQFLEGAGPSARNQDNNTFETYMNDMMSVSRSDFLRKDGTSRISPFGAFDKLITKTFGLTEQGGLNAMSVAQVSYANNLKEYALAKKIQSTLTKAQIKKPNTTVIDLNLSKIILEEMVSQGQNAPKPNDVADAIKKIYGLSGGSADGIISNYGQYLYDNITSGEFSLGVKPFRTHVRNAAKSQQVRESRRGEKSRESSATTQLEYERILDSLVDVDTDVFEDVARSVDASTLKQLANTLRVNTKAYDSLFKVVQKSYPDISEDMDEEELIDTAGEILRNYTKEEHVILARDLNRSVDGINLANALLDVGWLPPVGDRIITPRQTAGTTAQVEPLPQRATPAQKRQRILDAKALARATIGVQFSQADGRMLADEARKVNNAEIKRLGIVSNDPESVIAALRDLQESGTPMQRLVAGVLTANVDLIRNVRFTIGDMNDVRFAGAFMPKSNLVVVNISGHNGRGIVDVLLHEYLHAVTVQTMTNPKTPAQVAAMQRIASLRALTAAQAEKMGLDTEGFESALSDDLEFVTVALTDPEFQTLVRAATPTAQRSLLSRIWESLRSLFGYDSTNKKLADAFDELLDFTQMFAGANTFNIKSERNLRLEAHKIREGLSALREFASVKGQSRTDANRKRDAAYLAAVEAGDMEMAQRMVDEAARAAGYDTLPLYRSDATKWSIPRIITYLSPSIKLANQFSSLDTSSAVFSTELTGDSDTDYNTLKRLVAEYPNATVKQFDKIYVFPRGSKLSSDDSRKFYIKSGLKFATVGDEVNGKLLRTSSMFRSNTGIQPSITLKFDDITAEDLIADGYDGVAGDMDGESDSPELAVLSSANIKIADPVTRDNNGNVIPLSQRFQIKDADIRYSLSSGRRSFLDDLDSELQSEIYGGSAARERRIRESVAYTGASSKSGELRSQEIDGYDGPELPTASGWLSPKGKFFALDPSDTGLSAGFGTHQQRLLDILVNEHSEAELDEVLLGLGFDNIYDLSENEVYLIGYELGYARILDSGDEIYVEKWHSNRDIPTPKALTPPQILALKKAGKLEEKTVMRDGVPTPLYIPPQYDYTSFSLGSEASGEVAIDVVSEFESQLPEGMSLNVDSNFKGEAGIRRSQPNVIYVNPELLSNRVAGLSEDAARAAIKGLVNHEVAHFAALNAFTPEHIARVATELGEDQLQKVAEQYYSTAGLTAEETLANIKADRESGVLSNERIADEWIRMQVEKAVVGQTYEDVIRGTKGNQTLIGTIVDAIKAFVTRLRQRFVDYPSAETAAAISHASRTLRKVNQNGSIDFNADLYESNRFGDTANLFASLDGSPVGDQVSYSIPVLSSNAGKVDALNDRLKLYNLPSQLRDVLNLRSGTVNQIAASSKALVKYFPKYRDLALKGGVSMDEIKLLFGTTAPPLTDSDLKEIADKALIFEATIPVTETEGRKADLVAEYSEKLKRERRLRFNDAFVKLQQAAEQSITDAGFGQLVNEAVAFRKDINKFKGLTGFDESDDVYLTRAYKFFNTEGWSMAAKMGGVIKIEGKDVDFGKLRDAAAAAYYEEAEAEFQKIGKPYTDKDVTDLTLKKLDNYLSTLETMTSAVDARVVESIRKDLNRFKPKKDIDSTFRELLGEIDDPLANAVNTLYRVGMLSANEKFRTDFAKTAIDLGLASKEPKAGWITSFAASSAPRTGDLAGLYFEPKVAGVLSEVIGANTKGLNAHSTNLMNGLGRAAMGVSGVAIQMKTQFGVGYWPRNAIGGYVLSAAQGIFMNPFSAKGKQARTESWRASFASLPTEQAQRESILRLIQLNVLNDQSQGRVAQDLLRGLIASPEQELQELMSALDEARATKDAGGVFARIQQNGYLKGGLDKALSGYSQVTDKLAALDGAIDGMFKANAYYYELDAIKKHFGSSMATEQQEEAAARKVKLTFAGNSQVIDLVKSFNKTPMAALFLPFARWKSEVFRTMLNTIPLAMEEIGQGGVMARRGAQRLTSFIATLVAAPAVLGTLATTVFRALTGDDEEEERKLTAVELAALRESLPQWQRGHQLNAQILKGGRIQFIDMDFILPHSQLTNLVSIITEGIQTGDGVNASRLASYVTGDLIGTQIAATAIDEILNNADDRGQPIYLETDNAAQKMQRMLGHYAKGALLPSSLVKGSELLREGQTNREEIFWGEVLGSRPKTVTFGDVERRGFRNLKGLLDNSVSIIGGLTSGRFKSDSEIDDVVDRHQDALNETQRRLNRFMRSMVSMGSTESSVYSSAKIYKFSDDTISSAYQGYRIAWRPNDKWNQKTYFNAEQAKEQDPTQKIQSVDRSVNRKAAVNYVNDAYDE
jgi:hypothetical protein